jgi:hypothetical protein
MLETSSRSGKRTYTPDNLCNERVTSYPVYTSTAQARVIEPQGSFTSKEP